MSGVGRVCNILGKQRQAYYKAEKRTEKSEFKGELVLEEIEKIRQLQPRIGCVKLHHQLRDFLQSHKIKLGEKKLRVLLKRHGLLKPHRRKIAKTTFSGHGFWIYKNLVKDVKVTQSEQVWVSDITYVKSNHGFSYLSLITDAYSRKIIGWSLRNDLCLEGPLEALKMAMKNRRYPKRELIHHSDRGIQYCSRAYIKLLKKYKAKISMTQSGNPYDNALAERMNNTIKNEFLEGRGIMDLSSGKQQLAQIIWVYNECRLHWSLDFKTPEQVHQHDLRVKKRWKKVDWELRKKRKKEIDLEKMQYYRY